MATTVATQTLTLSGTSPTYTAVSGDTHKSENDGRVILHIKNTDSADHDVTIKAYGTLSGLVADDVTVTVSANTERMIGPFPTGVFNNASGQLEALFGSNVANVTMGAFRI